jgi:hypothetical protein
MPLLSAAFNMILSKHGRNVQIFRGDEGAAVNIRVTPANYFRNLAGPEEIIVEGAEFILSKKVLDDVNFPKPRRGDVIKDAELGYKTLSEVREMYDFGGSILGYRVRTI